MIKKGYKFTHDHLLDPRFVPGPGQRYSDAPKAEMVVTSIRKDTVYYGYTNLGTPRGYWTMDLAKFEEKYGNE